MSDESKKKETEPKTQAPTKLEKVPASTAKTSEENLPKGEVLKEEVRVEPALAEAAKNAEPAPEGSKKEVTGEVVDPPSEDSKGEKKPEESLKVKETADKEETENPDTKKVEKGEESVGDKLAKEVEAIKKNTIYCQEWPAHAFVGSTAAGQSSFAAEAGRHLLATEKWTVETITMPNGSILQYIK